MKTKDTEEFIFEVDVCEMIENMIKQNSEFKQSYKHNLYVLMIESEEFNQDDCIIELPEDLKD